MRPLHLYTFRLDEELVLVTGHSVTEGKISEVRPILQSYRKKKSYKNFFGQRDIEFQNGFSKHLSEDLL